MPILDEDTLLITTDAETLSEPMKITVSEHIFQLIKDDFVCSERGEFEVKGFGMNPLY